MKLIKRYLSLLLLVLGGFCIAVMLMEGLIRVLYPHCKDHVIPGGLLDVDYDLGWKLKPASSATHYSRYFNVVYNINSLGFRDKPRDVSKHDNIYRVLLYGDSQVFGWGVPAEKRFSNFIENEDQYKEIWNLAVPGHGLDQQILSYKRDGKSLNADEVILFVSNATLERTRHAYIYGKHKPIFITDETGKLKSISIPRKNFIITNSAYKILSSMYLPYFLERRIGMMKKHQENSSRRGGPETNIATGNLREMVGDLEKKMLSMARIIALGRGHRITILCTLSDRLRDNLKHFCDQNGIGFLEIDLDHEKQILIFGRHDSHWNQQAHRLIANQLLSQLEKMNLP